jgi:hypothetical protein
MSKTRDYNRLDCSECKATGSYVEVEEHSRWGRGPLLPWTEDLNGPFTETENGFVCRCGGVAEITSMPRPAYGTG